MSQVSPSWDGQFSQVESRSTAEQIADQLRAAIFYGHLRAASQLNEVELAQRFGVSRGPVREALQRLMQEGLLVRARNRGVFVADFSDADIHDIYLAREAVERAAVARLLETSPANAVDRLQACVDAMEAAARVDDSSSFTKADLEFHSTLVELSGSQRLARIHRTLLVEARLCMTRLEGKYTDPLVAVAEHADLVTAIAADDRTRAFHLIEQHMTVAVDLLVESPPG